MSFTLDQARVFVTLAKEGSLQAAARSLHRQVGSIAYALKQLEEVTGLELVDRSGYRLKLTPAGKQILPFCERLTAAELGLTSLCHELSTGWEPQLTVVVDGIFPVGTILRALRRAIPKSAPTRISVISEYLSGVERAFLSHQADVMIAVLPPEQAVVYRKLDDLPARLVVHKDHGFARSANVSDKDLESEVLLTVRESDHRLELPTSRLSPSSVVQLNDFHAKRDALCQAMGYGWLPDYLAMGEIDKGTLVEITWSGESRHVFHPVLCTQRGKEGRALKAFLEALLQEENKEKEL